MPRIIGTDIPDNKPLHIALTYIYGVGKHSAKQIIDQLDLDPGIRAKELTEEQLALIANAIEAAFVVEGALRRQVSQNINRLRDIHCYRGDRHRRGLPCRGQRTKTNARTRKGRRRTVATKKGIKGMK